MSNAKEQQSTSAPPPTALHDKAEENLRFIRASMEGASSFTGVSGKAYVIAGVSALFAAWLAAQQTSPGPWLAIWMLELLFAASVSFFMIARKAKNQGGSLWSTTGKKLLLAFCPTMTVGGILTLALYQQGNIAWLPGIWLSLYGAAVITAGVYSVAIIPVMGAAFLLLGGIVLLTPMPVNLALGLGMGGLHIIFGCLVWRNYGG